MDDAPGNSDVARRRAALQLLDAAEPAFRATARRLSLCAADADDAFQRSVEILLTKGPTGASPRHLAAWMQVVTRREALALRRARERLLGRSAPPTDHLAAAGTSDPLDHVVCDRPDPAERFERRERLAEATLLLAELKPHERRALVLQAHGYSYAEIGEICGWTYTKVNRCLSEGRARLRELRTALEVNA